MKSNFIRLLKENSSNLIYEWNPKTKELIWHTKNKFFSKNNPDSSNFENLFAQIILEDKKLFSFNKLENKKDYIEFTFHIFDKNNKSKSFMDKSTKIILDNEEVYIGSIEELAFNKTQLKINNILNSIDDLIFYKNLNFEYIECNDAFCKFVNLEKKELLGKKDKDFINKELAHFINSFDKELLKTGKTQCYEFWIKNHKNQKRYIQTKKILLLNENNKPFAIFAIARDLTDKIKNQKLLEDSKKSYIQLFEANKVPVLFIDPKDGKILDANKAALNFYGYSLEEIKKIFISNINTLSKEEIQYEMKLAKEEKRDSFLFRHKLKSNEIKDVEVFSGPLEYENKKILYSIIHDVTNKVKVQKALRQANTIYQNTKEGIFITNLQGDILSANKAFTDITGYTKEEILGKNPKFLKSNKHPISFYKELWEEINKNGYWEGEIINKNKNGKCYPQWLTINTVYDLDNEPINYIAVFSDFTKLKEQEKLLREKDHIMFQQSKMASMGEMLRNIAHQWRQPLSVISSSASGLKLKHELEILHQEEIAEFCDGILKSSKYLSDTIDDFTDFFKNQNQKANFSIKDAIQRAIILSSASLKNNDIELKTQIEEVSIYGVENEFVQVLLNLINNAKDALKNIKIENKTITIKSLIEKNLLKISIKDNAGGVPLKFIDKIFEPYFTTKDKLQGTGIGLYMSQEIITNHLNGTIKVLNYKNKEQKGAEFIIEIPL
ncbi:PAS domain-containing sensor histidine kinase [Malaciobacter mytili]|uniref:sensor histidine kinase n=1 Tax=Malaciobacter mytili TaxID=603050 RepID=UPI003BAF228E